MSKAIAGAAELAGAVVLGGAAMLASGGAAAFLIPGLIDAMGALAMGGVSMEAGAIANALSSNRGMAITTRAAASFQQIIYGQQRVGGVVIKQRTSGSSNDQMNYIIVIAGHEVESIQNLYLDGRQVFWLGSGDGFSVRNGVGFGGVADNNSHTGPNGVQYNFGGTGHSGIYCEARYGDQLDGDVIGAATANMSEWAADGNGNSPWVGGCCYVYLKVEFNTELFPNPPDIRFTVNGKNNIWDPRTQTSGFTQNWALIAADIITDPVYGLGDNTVNQVSLIAAANVCDEAVELAAIPGASESRYTCNYHYDTSVAPGDALQAIMSGAGGGFSQIGGEYYVWPAYWQGSSFSFGIEDITAPFQWKPYRSVPDLINRVNGTYIAPTYPYNIAGNLYDKNGFYNGEAQNNFPFAFQPTNYPQYAADTLHGYPVDQYLAEDNGIEHPFELDLSSVLSVTQAQRLAKICLMRNRFQGTGVLEMRLGAYVMQPKDVFSFTFPPLNWVNHLLEVTSVSLVVDEDQDTGAQSIRVRYTVIETDSSIYDWTPDAEEETVYDIPASPNQAPPTPTPPTDMTLNSGPSVAQINPDGTVNNLIVVGWTVPADLLAIGIYVQYRQTGATDWISAPSQSITLNSSWISNVIPSAVYDVRIASYRANGQVSTWVEQDAYTVINTPTDLGTLAAQLPAISANSKLAGTVNGEMLVNGNFANGLTGWTTSGVISTAEFYRGTQSLQLLNQEAVQGVTLKAGRTYLLQCWIMTNGNVTATGAYGAGMVVQTATNNGLTLLDANTTAGQTEGTVNTGYLDVEIPVTVATSWELVQMVFSCSVTGLANVIVQNSVTIQGVPVTATAWFDGVSLTDVTAQSAQLGGVVASLITPITDLMPDEAGADKTSNQAIAYTGASGSLVPNGTLLLGNAQGYQLIRATFDVGPPININVPEDGYAITQSFQVIPGQSYQFQFDGGVGVDGTRVIYHRVYFSSLYSPNVSDVQTVPGYVGYQDFLAAGNMNNAATTYTYYWTCPAGVYCASLAGIQIGSALIYFTRFIAIDFGASAQWGSDVTGTNTSNDTSHVDGVPSATIAQVVPTGYELFINNGSREYSFQAV